MSALSSNGEKRQFLFQGKKNTQSDLTGFEFGTGVGMQECGLEDTTNSHLHFGET